MRGLRLLNTAQMQARLLLVGGAMTSFNTKLGALSLAMSLFVACGGDGEVTGTGGSGGQGAATQTGGMGGTGGAATGGGGAGGQLLATIAWNATQPMSSARRLHTATLLNDGRVLVVGGENLGGAVLDTSELFDPGTGQWSPGPTFAVARANHAAVSLGDGRVAIIGGGNSSSNGLPAGTGVTDSVEIFDPTNDTVSAGPSLLHARGHHRAVMLEDGRVLVVGGVADGGTGVAETEVLPSDMSAWADVGTITTTRALFGLVKRTSGDVVIAGGVGAGLLNQAERFDPSNDTWTALPNMTQPRMFIGLAPLASGGVLAAGGLAGNNLFVDTTEYLPADNSAWQAGPSFPNESAKKVVGGTGVTLLALSSGDVLAVGGYGLSFGNYGPGDFSGIYDEANAAWTKVGTLDTSRASATATQLEDGRVLLTGGIGANNGATASCSLSESSVP